MNYDRTQRIRRAAILVAHLEESLAEQMLESLPRPEAMKILDEVDRLDELDQEEVADVLDEFRSAGRRGRRTDDAVEFTYSAPSADAAASAAMVAAAKEAAAAATNSQSEADAVLMAELLMHEHPQTIAAALSRLGHERGAAVFAALPAGLQAEVLDRLANLEPADESVVMELESQLQQRVEQHRQRKDRASAAKEMARQILSKTAPGQREVLMARLSSKSSLSGGVNRADSTTRAEYAVSKQAQILSSAVQSARSTAASEAYAETGHFEVWADEASEDRAKTPATSAELEDRSRELEALDDRSLLEALRIADERTVQCALAASSERFFKRVAGKLPRQQASRLRQVVRSIGPTRLAELREAQHELLRIARGGEAVGVASQ
jgi:flagellar motor switch protein FliG